MTPFHYSSHLFFFFQAEDGIRDAQESRGLGDVYKRQGINAEYGNVSGTTGPSHRTTAEDRLSHLRMLLAGLCEEWEEESAQGCSGQGNASLLGLFISETADESFEDTQPSSSSPTPVEALSTSSPDAIVAASPPVSYTHLTLPTKRIVEISVVAVSLKKKKIKKIRITEDRIKTHKKMHDLENMRE
eukprot:TRINITY_DN53694_c0_g1_i1.p1 TRINITY_DN53694_c0_g1~~TRINITY_DN53694_c0_g1_i1.p1  ORF type:complete len:187 (-),score=51.94 TRINITY_DN53694_c0_g1_i1:21-581(-)